MKYVWEKMVGDKVDEVIHVGKGKRYRRRGERQKDAEVRKEGDD